MIDLKEIKLNTDPALWSRGKSYFRDGAVEQLENLGDGHWEAIVTGTMVYEVSVEIQFDHVQNWDCNCPYEGNMCKHVVATLLAIQDKKKTITLNIPENEAKPKTFDQLLASISADELLSFVKQYASSDRKFKQALQVSFAEKNPAGGKAQYAKLISQSFQMAMGRHGFIDYYQSGKAFKTVFDLIQKANELLDRNNYMDPWLIASAVIEKVAEIAENIDDSDGVIVDSFEGAFDLISKLCDRAEVPMPLKEQMFDWHKTEYNKDKYEDYGNDSLLFSMVDLAEECNRSNELIPILDSAIEKVESDFELIQLLEQKARLLKSLGRLDEYFSFLNDHVQHHEIRRMKLAILLRQHQYQEAEKLIEEGILISESQLRGGTTQSYKEQLLEIYGKTDRKDNYLSMLRELFYESNRKYYPLFKQTIGPEKWPDELEQIIAKLKKNRRDWHFLFELYAAEQMFPELLQLVSQHAEFRLIKTYESILFPKFPEELIQLYEQTCLNFAFRTNSRGDYKELASMLKQVQKLEGGKPVVTKLVSTFRETYKRRPAMMDELRNLN